MLASFGLRRWVEEIDCERLFVRTTNVASVNRCGKYQARKACLPSLRLVGVCVMCSVSVWSVCGRRSASLCGGNLLNCWLVGGIEAGDFWMQYMCESMSCEDCAKGFSASISRWCLWAWRARAVPPLHRSLNLLSAQLDLSEQS